MTSEEIKHLIDLRRERDRMTNEETIEVLDDMKIKIDIPKSAITQRNRNEALDKAIKALEQQPFINKPCISEGVCREDKMQVLDKIRAEIMQLDYDLEDVDYDYNDMTHTETVHMICREEVLQILDKYKAESEE